MNKRRPKHLVVVELESRINPVTVSNFDDTTSAGSLRAAINAINNSMTSGTIDFDPDIFTLTNTKTINLTDNLPQLKYDAVITGFSDNFRVKINATKSGNHYDVFGIDPSATTVDIDVSGVTILGSSRGLLFDGGTHIVDNLNFEDGIGSSGLAIQATNGAEVTITDSTFTNNAASGSGGAIRFDGGGTLTISNSIFEDNTAAVSGGSIFVADGDLILNDVTISGSTVASSSTSVAGGAIYIGEGTLTLGNTGDVTISGCSATTEDATATARGGAIFIGDGDLILGGSGTEVEISSCTVASKTGVNAGGAIFIGNGSLTGTNSISITNCTARDVGGAIRIDISQGDLFSLDGSDGAIQINNCAANAGGALAVTGGTAGQGNGSDGLFSLNNVTLSGNTAGTSETPGIGGAMLLTTCSAALIESCTISNCSSSQDGGGIAVVSRSDKISPTLTITQTTIDGCTAVRRGGGLFGLDYFGIELDHVTIDDCHATTPTSMIDTDPDRPRGGGMFLGGLSSIYGLIQHTLIKNCTSSNDGGGIYNAAETVNDGKTVFVDGGRLRIEDSSILDNSAGHVDDPENPTVHVGRGGGVFYGGKIEISVSPVEGFMSETLDVVRTTLAGNKTEGNGGGLYYEDTASPQFLFVDSSTFSDNSAYYAGGGICATIYGHYKEEASIIAINSTLTNNSASVGGGMALPMLSGQAKFLFTTITGNTVGTSGGGLRLLDAQNDQHAATVTIDASVLSGNFHSSVEDNARIPEFEDLSVSLNHSAMLSLAGIDPSNAKISYSFSQYSMLDLSEVPEPDLLLGSLGDYGGPTESCMPFVYAHEDNYLYENSPLIDAVPSSVFESEGLFASYLLYFGDDILRDQRGVPRPISVFGNSWHDIGSVEVYGDTNLEIASFTVNENDTQRSRLTTITIQIGNTAAANLFHHFGVITLTRTHATPAGEVGTIVQTGATGANGRILVEEESGWVSSITITFDNADSTDVTPGVEYGSLADGRWQLAIPIANFKTTLGSTTLRRLFGDSNNNGSLDHADDIAFEAALTSDNTAFDFNQDDDVEVIIDLAAFNDRIGIEL